MTSTAQTPPLWSDDDIVGILRQRQHHLKLANGWSVITLIAAAELMRMVRDDYLTERAVLLQRIAELEAALAQAQGWEDAPAIDDGEADEMILEHLNQIYALYKLHGMRNTIRLQRRTQGGE